MIDRASPRLRYSGATATPAIPAVVTGRPPIMLRYSRSTVLAARIRPSNSPQRWIPWPNVKAA